MNPTLHFVFICTAVSTACSILHSTLPPWDHDMLKPFPKFAIYYRIFIYMLGGVAINLRSTVWTQISTQKDGGVNESVVHTEAPKP